MKFLEWSVAGLFVALFVLVVLLICMSITAAGTALLAMLINYCFGTAISVKGAAIFGAFFPLLRGFVFGFPSRNINITSRR